MCKGSPLLWDTGHGLKRVSSFLRTIKAMSTHQSPRPTKLDLSRGGAVSNVRRDTLFAPEPRLGVTGPWVGI